MGNISNAGKIWFDVKIGTSANCLLGGDGKVGVIRAHHPAVLEGKGMWIARLKKRVIIFIENINDFFG